MRRRNPLRTMTGGIFLLFLALAFLVSHGGAGIFFLPILFVGLAISSLIGSLGFSTRGAYGGLYGFVWCLGLAFCFLFGFWPWILFVVAFTVLLGALARPIMAALAGMGIFAMANSFNGQPHPAYQPPYPQQNPYQPPYQAPYPQQDPHQPSYQEGYQSPPPQPTSENYQEGGKQYPYPSQQYEQPQAQYPQELPPQ